VAALEVEPVDAQVLTEARARIARAHRIIVKVGSSVLVGGSAGLIDRRIFCGLVETLALLTDVPHRRVVLVSSGAVAVGRRQAARLTGSAVGRPDTLAARQALASLGQPMLMHLYSEEFSFYAKKVAQVLMTRDDIANRERFLNARNTFRELEGFQDLVPIVNENDTVATEELRFGDNDQLAALLTTVVGADLLVILSDVRSVFDSDPTRNADARPIGAAYADDAALAAMAGPASDAGFGTGGMASKIRAARMAGSFGVPTIIAPGREPESIGRILSGEAGVGTILVPRDARLNARKAWIRFGSRPLGVISVDEGAERAIRTQGRSLLPTGIVGVTGEFGAGAAVELQGVGGVCFGRGLASYASAEIQKLLGARSEQITQRLGYSNGDAVVHRDDLVVIGEREFDA
jgi:glutamate 5-kinase